MAGHIRKRHRATCAKKQDGRKRCNCDGPWQARIPDPSRPGTTFKIEKQFRTEREAQAWQTSQENSKLTGAWFDPRTAERPFSDVLDAWQGSWTNRLSPTTASRYRGIVEKYLTPRFGTTPVARITHEVVQRYVDELNEQGMSAGSVRNIFAVLRNATNKGVRLGMVRVNPCTSVDLPRSPREEMLFLDADQVRAVAEGIDKWYRVLVYTAAYTGLRAGELLALRRQDVDLLRGVVHVRRSLRDVEGRLEWGDLKTDHSRRTISLPKFLVAMLTEHLAQALPGGNGPDALVFPSKTGKPIRHNLMYRRHFKTTVAGWTDKKGTHHPGVLPERLHGLRWHDLRHTACSLSVAAGANVKQVSARLGHSSVMITLDRYTHLFESGEQSVADALDAIYSAAPSEPATNVVALAR